MTEKRSFIAGVLVTLVAAFALLMLTGAVKSKTANLKSDVGLRHPQRSAMHVACSSDGNSVYVADGSRVLFSRDRGANWQVVLTNNQHESSKK